MSALAHIIYALCLRMPINPQPEYCMCRSGGSSGGPAAATAANLALIRYERLSTVRIKMIANMQALCQKDSFVVIMHAAVQSKLGNLPPIAAKHILCIADGVFDLSPQFSLPLAKKPQGNEASIAVWALTLAAPSGLRRHSSL